MCIWPKLLVNRWVKQFKQSILQTGSFPMLSRTRTAMKANISVARPDSRVSHQEALMKWRNSHPARLAITQQNQTIFNQPRFFQHSTMGIYRIHTRSRTMEESLHYQLPKIVPGSFDPCHRPLRHGKSKMVPQHSECAQSVFWTGVAAPYYLAPSAEELHSTFRRRGQA